MSNDSDTTAEPLTRPPAPADWAPEAWAAAAIDETWPDVSAVVQELVARPGFSGEART